VEGGAEEWVTKWEVRFGKIGIAHIPILELWKSPFRYDASEDAKNRMLMEWLYLSGARLRAPIRVSWYIMRC